MEDMTTMARAIMVVWFTPARMLGMARGRRTSFRSCHRVAP